MNLGVRAKFLIVMVSVVVVADLTAGIYLQWKLRMTEEQRVEHELGRHARAVRDALVLGLEDGGLVLEPQSVDAFADQLGDSVDARVTIIEHDGRVVGDSKLTPAELERVEHHDDRPEVQRAGASDCGLARRHSATLGTDMLYCAITFEARLSVWKVPTVTTTLDRGSILRATTDCSATTTWQPTRVVSTARCGSAAWPPLPVMVIVNSSDDAISGPGRIANWPTGRPGAL